MAKTVSFNRFCGVNALKSKMALCGARDLQGDDFISAESSQVREPHLCVVARDEHKVVQFTLPLYKQIWFTWARAGRDEVGNWQRGLHNARAFSRHPRSQKMSGPLSDSSASW